jgi:hypothetical protein
MHKNKFNISMTYWRDAAMIDGVTIEGNGTATEGGVTPVTM